MSSFSGVKSGGWDLPQPEVNMYIYLFTAALYNDPINALKKWKNNCKDSQHITC